MFDRVVRNKRTLVPGTSRRDFLRSSNMGFGWLTFAGLANPLIAVATPETRPVAPQSTLNFAPRAKHVIFLFMDGGVSHVDSFDPKPKLTG